MDNQRIASRTPRRQKKDAKAAACESLREMFSGSLDPEVVNLILSESDYNVEDAIEKLFTLASSNPVSTIERNSFKPSTVKYECTDSSKVVADGDGGYGHPTARKMEYDSIDDIRLGKEKEPQGHCKAEVSHFGKRLVDSADNLVNSCISSAPEDLNKETQDQQETGNSISCTRLERETKSQDSNESEPFGEFLKNFMSANSNEWNSTRNAHQPKHNSYSYTGPHKKDMTLSQEENFGSKLVRTSNRNSPKNMNLQDISKTSISGKNPIEETSVNSTALPAWPDTQQFGQQFQNPQQLQRNPYSRTSNPQNFHSYAQNHTQGHPKNFGFTPNCGPPYPQFQARPGYFNVNQAFHVPRLRYQLPRQPMGYPGQGNYGQVRHPPGFATPQQTQKPNYRKPPFKLPDGKVLVIMRGLPGSGKSTFARTIKGSGVVLSTDDFFMQNGQYRFDSTNLGEAHEWNQLKAREAMKEGMSPVIIDNTNTQAWEMKPYVSMAQRLGYQIIFKEPDTYWRWNAKELFRRNQHGISLSGIKNMMERYEHDLTVDHVLKSTSLDKKPREEQTVTSTNSQQETKNEPAGSESDTSDSSKECVQNIQHGNFTRQKPNPIQNKSEERKYHETLQVGSNGDAVKGIQEVNKQTNTRKQFSQKNTNTVTTKRKKTDEALVYQRSHGSRSPVLEFEQYMADERKEIENDVKLEIEEGDVQKTNSPKPQRAPRRRERKTDGKELPAKEMEMCSLPLESKSSCDDVIAKLCMASGSSESSVEVMSEEGSEEFSSKQNDFGASEDGIDEASTQSVHNKGSPKTKKETSLNYCQQKFDFKQKISPESDIDSEVDNRDSGSQQSTRSTTDDAYVSDDEESDDVVVESDDTDDEINDVSNKVLSKSRISDSLREEEEISPAKPKREEAEREEKLSSHVISSEDSEIELSGFEFLNTCFPNIDDKTLLGILSGHEGDVNKAIETILKNSERYMGETVQNSDPTNRSCYSSDSSKDDVPPKQSKDASSPLELLTAANQTSFQMSLEPAVAFHLFELFGPIKGVNFKGEFSASDLSVNVDMEFSKLLYHQWKKSIQKNKGFGNDINAAQARSPKSQRKQKHRTRLNLHEPLPPPPKNKSKPTDLREIMHEQLALEQSRREQDKRESDNNMAVVLKRQKLFAMFPGVDPTALEEIFEANRYELQPTVAMVSASCNIQAKSTSLFQDETSNDDEEDWGLFPFPDDKEMHSKAYQALEDPGYLDFRGEANMHYKLRDECFKKAALAFSQKQGQLAQFYAAQGHQHTEKIKEANDRAAARILEHKNADKDQFVLDLHGLHVPEALQALEERLNPPDFIYKPRYIAVVTGRGLHSKQGKAKIKPAVLDYLQRNNYRHEEMHAGQIKVFLK